MKKISRPVWLKIAKVAGIVIGVYLLIMIGISIYIASSKERIVQFLTSQLKESVDGKIEVEKADILVWSTFPKIGVELDNLSISDSLYHKPVFKAGKIIAKIGLFDAFGNSFNIHSFHVENAMVHVFTDKNGYKNKYVFQPKNKKKKSGDKKPVVINNLEIKNFTFISEHFIRMKRHQITLKRADADMTLDGDMLNIHLDEDAFIRGLGFNMYKGYWLENQTVKAEWDIHLDTKKQELKIDEAKAKISGQPFLISGAFYLADSANAHFELYAKTKQIPFGKAMAILKPTTREKLNKVDLKKPIDASISLVGPLAYKSTPEVKVEWATKNNVLVTPVTTLDSVTFNGNFTNNFNDSLPYSDENSHVNFNLFTAKWGAITLTAKQVAVTNLKVPELQMQFYSDCTFPQLDEQLNSDVLMFKSGTARLFFSYKGPIVSDPALLNRLNAQINLNNGEVLYLPTNMTFTNCNGKVLLFNNNLYVKDLTCNLNKSKITVNVQGNNLNRLSTNESGKAVIDCKVTSPLIDLADLKKLFNPRQQTTAKRKPAKASKNSPSMIAQVDNALENGTLNMNLSAGQVLLNHFKATDVATVISFKEDNWEFNKVYLRHAGGTLNMTGVVKRTSSTMHNANVHLDVNKMDVSQVFYSFDNFGMESLKSNNIKGNITTKSNLDFNLNNDGNMLPGTMNGYLDFSLKKGALLNFKPVMDIQKFAFKNRDLSDIEFEELKDKLEIKKGNIYINRMPIQSTAFLIYVEGVYSLKDETNIAIQVPIKTIFSKPDYDKKALASDKGGASIWLRAKSGNDGKVKVGLDVFKKLRNDKYEDVIFDSTDSNDAADTKEDKTSKRKKKRNN